jgi:MFS transporter, ACS family, tartrate transporter
LASSRDVSEPHPPSSADSAEDIHSNAIGASALRKASVRLIPVLCVGYGLAYMDRISVSFAALRMNVDLHFSATIYGFGAGLFFIGNAISEVPSNLLLLRFGAKRVLASIIFLWGVVATAMMLVRTPMEFYVLRLLLGIGEAGFYPGVIYYLTLWYPARMRARAVSRFYIALPLSSVVMGGLAGWLMGLDGTLGLSGWQWLFLVEGLPAVLFSAVILMLLPDNPAKASWLTSQERSWIQQQLGKDGAQAHLGHSAGVLRALLSPKVWMIGLFFFFVGVCGYGFGFSAPAILQNATGWSIGQVGWMIALFGLAGAVAMLMNGAHSDRRGERMLHCIVPCFVMGAGFLVASYSTQPWLVVLSLAASFIASTALWGPALAIPMEFLAGRAAATGIAAMNSIAIFSGFAGPYAMGLLKDATGNYQAGLRGLVVSALVAAAIMYLLVLSLEKQPATRAEHGIVEEATGTGAGFSEESA